MLTGLGPVAKALESLSAKRAQQRKRSAVSSCTYLPRATTLPPMRSILRRAAVLVSAITLAFFWSCERHHPSELPNHEEHKPGEEAHGHGAAKDEHGHAKDAHGSADAHKQGAGESHAAPAAGTSPVGTPAQFFPASTPAPTP
jgi:hypothetical protein